MPSMSSISLICFQCVGAQEVLQVLQEAVAWPGGELQSWHQLLLGQVWHAQTDL